MKKRRLLLATAALALGCGGKKKTPEIYANPKGGHYDAGLVAPEPDGAVDAPTDADPHIDPRPPGCSAREIFVARGS